MSTQPAKTYDWSNGVEVKACWHCGSDRLNRNHKLPEMGIMALWILCENCQSCGPMKKSLHLAIAAWNRRASDEQIDTLTKALEIAFSFENGIENNDHCVNSGDNPVTPEWCTPQCKKCKVVYALKKTARKGK